MSCKVHQSSPMFYSLSYLIISLVSSATVWAQAPPPQDPVATPAPGTGNIPSLMTPVNTEHPNQDDNYRVGPGDLLDIRVFGRPELGREARITNHGRIRLPFIEEFQAGCL